MEFMANTTAKERRALIKKANSLAHVLISHSKEYDTSEVIIAAETLIAFRATGSKMSIGDLMDNIVKNLPEMYKSAIRTSRR